MTLAVFWSKHARSHGDEQGARLAFLIVRRKPSKARPLSVRAVAAALAHGPRHPHQCDHRDEAPDRVQVDGHPCGEEHAVASEQPGANEVEPLLGKRGGLDPAGREQEVGAGDEERADEGDDVNHGRMLVAGAHKPCRRNDEGRHSNECLPS